MLANDATLEHLGGKNHYCAIIWKFKESLALVFLNLRIKIPVVLVFWKKKVKIKEALLSIISQS